MAATLTITSTIAVRCRTAAYLYSKPVVDVGCRSGRKGQGRGGCHREIGQNENVFKGETSDSPNGRHALPPPHDRRRCKATTFSDTSARGGWNPDKNHRRWWVYNRACLPPGLHLLFRASLPHGHPGVPVVHVFLEIAPRSGGSHWTQVVHG